MSCLWAWFIYLFIYYFYLLRWIQPEPLECENSSFSCRNSSWIFKRDFSIPGLPGANFVGKVGWSPDCPTSTSQVLAHGCGLPSLASMNVFAVDCHPSILSVMLLSHLGFLYNILWLLFPAPLSVFPTLSGCVAYTGFELSILWSLLSPVPGLQRQVLTGAPWCSNFRSICQIFF